MADLDLVTKLYLIGGVIGAAIVIWFFYLLRSNRRFKKTDQDRQQRFDETVHQNEQMTAQKEQMKREVASLRNSAAADRAIIQKHAAAGAAAQTEIESHREKGKMLSKNLFMIGAQRDELKKQLTRHQNIVNFAKQKIAVLQTGANQGQDIYKTQLANAIEERKVLERKLDDAKSEQQSLSNLLASSRSEYSSVSELLTSAQTKLKNLEALEKKILSLEAEKVQLAHKATLSNKESESLRREVDQLDEVKEQNSQLVRCLESMDNSRKQHEDDARRYRSQFKKSEEESDTLRFRIGDIQKNFARMHGVHEGGELSGNGKAKAAASVFLSEPEGEIDNLTEIAGIDDVLEKLLHDLGIYHYRQITAFGPGEIARINSELKESKGRIEHDDWIGQASELHFKKYGDSQ